MNAHQRRVKRRRIEREEQEAYAAMAADCSCCPGCNILPCGGSGAGGLCDGLCFCRDDFRDDDLHGDDEYDRCCDDGDHELGCEA